LIINHNISALQSTNRLNKNLSKTEKAMERLSSGLRITRAADDAAGLAISEKMRAQIRGLNQAQRNIQDSISLIQTVEGGIDKIIDPPLQRMRELAVQASNDTLTDLDRLEIQKEMEQMKDGINDIANQTSFNGIQLLNVPNSEIHLIGPHQFSALTRDGLALTSKNGVDWETHPEGSRSIYINKMAFGKASDGTGLLVAVGDQGRISTSRDGENWTRQLSGTNDLLIGVSYGDGKFVAVGDNGTILTSGDGENWVQVNSETSTRFVGSSYEQGIYIATGFGGTISTSIDGETWETKSFAGAGTLREVASNDHRMIAVGDNGRLYYSDDKGENWTYHQTSVTGNFTSVVHNGERFVAITDDRSIEVSTDGLNWTTSAVADFALQDLSWGNNLFVVSGGDYSPPSARVLSSTDGLTWKETNFGKYGYLSAVTWAGDEEVIPLDNHLNFQVDANSGMTMKFERMNVTSDALGLDNLSVTTQSSAEITIHSIDQAISTLSSKRSQLGARHNALEHLLQNNSNYELNLNAAYSRITDADFAREMMEMTKSNILSQASQSILSQAHQQSQSILQLLR
jgi:flagellin